MAKIQRRWVTGKLYSVQGGSKRVRKLVLVGRAKVSGKEILMFRPQRKAKKQKKGKKRR